MPASKLREPAPKGFNAGRQPVPHRFTECGPNDPLTARFARQARCASARAAFMLPTIGKPLLGTAGSPCSTALRADLFADEQFSGGQTNSTPVGNQPHTGLPSVGKQDSAQQKRPHQEGGNPVRPSVCQPLQRSELTKERSEGLTGDRILKSTTRTGKAPTIVYLTVSAWPHTPTASCRVPAPIPSRLRERRSHTKPCDRRGRSATEHL